jgi:hypothetical protein
MNLNKITVDQEIYCHITDKQKRVILCKGIVLEIKSDNVVIVLITAVTEKYLGVVSNAKWALGLKITKNLQDLHLDLDNWNILSKNKTKYKWIFFNETKVKEIINRHKKLLSN